MENARKESTQPRGFIRVSSVTPFLSATPFLSSFSG